MRAHVNPYWSFRACDVYAVLLLILHEQMIPYDVTGTRFITHNVTMVSSIASVVKLADKEIAPTETSNTTGEKSTPTNGYSTICITIFIFRGMPDVYHDRHVLLYFTSPDLADFHETVHVQRSSQEAPWGVDRLHTSVDWTMMDNYFSHVNAGSVTMPSGQEMAPVDISAAVSMAGRELNSGWNCQHFVLEGPAGHRFAWFADRAVVQSR